MVFVHIDSIKNIFNNIRYVKIPTSLIRKMKGKTQEVSKWLSYDKFVTSLHPSE